MMYCIVDIETTGGNYNSGKITEIAMFKYDGFKVVDSYSSLVNPERTIPPFISNLTGITNEMVKKAPKFYEIAKDIIEFTEDTIFVAHNVGFDYNFVRYEFKMLGYEFKRERICTVKSARKAFPGRKSYSLGKLCKDIGIELKSHHRATDDAKATTDLFHMILQNTNGSLKPMLEKDIKKALLNPKMDADSLYELPECTGVYYLLNAKQEIVYLGKSNNIRQRVHSHFRNDNSKRAISMIHETVEVKYEETGSELIALLKESEEIKYFKPRYNRAQKRLQENYGLYLEKDNKGYLRFKLQKIKRHENLITTFKSPQQAKNQIHQWTERFGLCQKMAGIHDHKGPCFGYHLDNCAGACIEAEKAEAYNTRVEKALSYLEYKHHSFIITDKGRSQSEYSLIMVENGLYMGFGYIDRDETITDPIEFKAYIEEKNDNREVRRIIRSYLNKKKIQKLIPF